MRFHAFQGLYLWVGWLLLDWVLVPVAMGRIPLAGLFKAATVCLWVVLMIKTSRGEMVRLPVLAELADRSLAEQAAGPKAPAA